MTGSLAGVFKIGKPICEDPAVSEQISFSSLLSPFAVPFHGY